MTAKISLDNKFETNQVIPADVLIANFSETDDFRNKINNFRSPQ